MSTTNHKIYTEILRSELVPAMGCTEPIAIAYAASIARFELCEMPKKVCILLSPDIIKNVKSVVVPATGGMVGIEAAVSAGIISGRPDKKLEVLSVLSGNDAEKIKEFANKAEITVGEIESDTPFEIRIRAERDEKYAEVHISNSHTNIRSVTKCGEDITALYLSDCSVKEKPTLDKSALNVKEIIEYANTVDLAEIEPIIRRQIDMNMAIAEEGLCGNYGATIGKLLYNNGNCTLRDKARAYAAAGSDARMSGCELPVCINSGSGNQGITASVPVVVYARETGADEETLLRALLVSDLLTIHIKSGIGCLSAYCGAVSAGCSAGAGICYLLGGGHYEIAHTLVNAVAILSGTICDGAKPSCAAKIAMAVDAGIMGYEMMKLGKQFYGGEGIVTKGVENTINNVSRLARDGMRGTDKEIIRIMLGDSK